MLEVFPEEAAAANNNLGNVYRRQGKLQEAVTEFEKGLALRENAKIRSNLAATQVKLGMIDEAEKNFTKAKEFDPHSELPDFGLGILYTQTGENEKALAAYAASLEHNPRYDRGLLLANLNRLEEAQHDFERAVEIEPLFVQAWFSLGVILQKEGKNDEAVHAYHKAIEGESGYIDARMNLGVLLAKLGKLPEARAQFSAVLRYQPGNASAASAIQKIDTALAQ